MARYTEDYCWVSGGSFRKVFVGGTTGCIVDVLEDVDVDSHPNGHVKKWE